MSHPELRTVHFSPRLISQRMAFIVSTLERCKSQTVGDVQIRGLIILNMETLKVLDIGSGPGTLLVELLKKR